MIESIQIWDLVLLGIVGVVSGWMNVMAGGGSMLTVPLMLFMGISGPVANGTNRIGIIFQNVAAVYGFFRKGFSDFKLSLTLAGCASIGAIGGASIGVNLEGVWFNYLLAVIMLSVMILTALGGEKKVENKAGRSKNLIVGHILMVFAGVWGGFIQIGVGFILMPILNRVMGLDLVRTNMHKVFIALSYSLFALSIFASKVGVLWSAGIALAVGTMIGGYVGAHTSVSKGEKWIKGVLYIVLSALIIKLLFFS